MRITYALSFADFRAAQSLHIRQKLIRRVNIFIWPVLAVILLIGMIVFGNSDHQELSAQCLIFGSLSLWFTMLFPIVRYLNARKGFKRFFLSGQTDQQISIDIDNERILSEIPGVGEGKYYWNTIIGFAQDDKVTLLYVYKDRFLVFPTTLLSPAQHAELYDLIAHNRVPSNRGYLKYPERR